MRVALTGTPGVGKSSVARAAEAAGWRVIDVKTWAAQVGAVAGHDEEDDADAIDVARLAKKVPRDAGSPVLYDGHLSHLLPLDLVWVLRCDPRVLANRLRARGYSAAKVTENLEAEALDVILQEALDSGRRVIQRDGTRRSPEAVLKAFADAGLDSAKGHDLEPVDWSEQLPIR